jgi:hypothetical protein
MIHLGIVANSDNINIDNKNLDNIVLSKYYGKVTAHKEITNMNIQKNEFDDDLLLELICSISSKTNLYNHRLFKNIPLEPINVLLVKICLKKNNKKYDSDSSCENGIKIVDSNNRTKFIKINVVQNVVTFLYYGKPVEMNNIAKFIEKVIESIMTNKKVGGKTRKRRFKS